MSSLASRVVFPGRTLCSLLLTIEDGASAEIAVVGPEGIVGIEAVLGVRVATCDAMVQVEGDGQALVMTVDASRAARHVSGIRNARAWLCAGLPLVRHAIGRV